MVEPGNLTPGTGDSQAGMTKARSCSGPSASRPSLVPRPPRCGWRAPGVRAWAEVGLSSPLRSCPTLGGPVAVVWSSVRRDCSGNPRRAALGHSRAPGKSAKTPATDVFSRPVHLICLSREQQPKKKKPREQG